MHANDARSLPRQMQLSHRLCKLAQPAHNHTPALSCAQVNTIECIKGPPTPPTTNQRKKSEMRMFCARSALMFMSHLLPRVQLAPSRFQCARRIECHFVFNSSDYLFFALFFPFERVCCHTVVLIACSETRALFPTCCTSCLNCHLLLYTYRCLHSLGIASVLLLSTMLYVAVSCCSLAFGLLFGLLWSLLSIKSLAYM